MLIIDGTYLVYKSYYVAEKIRKNHIISDHEHYKKIARNVFLKLISKTVSRFHARSLFIAFDCEGDNFRHELLSSYKANRKEKPEELPGIKQEIYHFLRIHKFCFQVGEKVEGDDLIASFVKQHPGKEMMVFTGDADLAALVRPGVTLFLDKRKTVQKVTEQNFHHQFPVPASKFPDFKALQGDKSDHLKGVDGLFRTEVLHLLMEYASVEDYFENGKHHHLYEKISADREKILINKQVASMKTDCPITVQWQEASLDCVELPEKIAKKINWNA